MSVSPIKGFKESIFGGNTDREDDEARRLQEEALAEFEGIRTPELGKVNFEDYSWLGDYTPGVKLSGQTIFGGDDVSYDDIDPRLSDSSTVDRSAFDSVSTDPRLRTDQTASLEALRELAESGGMTAADRANISKVRGDAAQADRGRREAILSNASARGMGGSGMELLAQLQSSQAATDRDAQAGLDVAGMAQDRALAALEQGGALAGNIRGQDFSEQASQAEARDAIARFNASNTQQNNQFNAGAANSTAQFNAGNKLQTDMYNRDTKIDVSKTNAGFAQNAAQFNANSALDASKSNWQGRQNTANSGVDTRNTAAVHNGYTAPQQQFQNSVTMASGKAGAKGAMGDFWSQQAVQKKAEAKDDMDLIIKGASVAAKKGS